MSDRMTSCSGPTGTTIANHGRYTRAEMIAKYRSFWQRQLELAQNALAAPDDELLVETYRGVWAQNNRQTVTD